MPPDETLIEYTRRHDDGTVESVSVRRTTDPTYPSGWRYSLHYGTMDGETILRYDNAHGRTKGHERHTGDGPRARESIDFPGMDALLRRFYREVEAHR